MVRFTCRIKDESGLHARPAGLLVKEASKYSSKVTIEKNGKTGDAKKLFGVMDLDVRRNDEVTFLLEGEQEETEAGALKDFIDKNL